MDKFIVLIKGEPDQAADLLAKEGIETTGMHSSAFVSGEDAPVRAIEARLPAETAEEARAKVLAALGDGQFTVEDAKPASE